MYNTSSKLKQQFAAGFLRAGYLVGQLPG